MLTCKHQYVILILITVSLLQFVNCKKRFNFNDCINGDYANIEILSHKGSRPEKNIEKNLVELYCVLTNLYLTSGSAEPELMDEYLDIKMLIEFNGEVPIVRIIETSIKEKELILRIKNYISEYEFPFYGNSDSEETEILFKVGLEK